MHSQLILLNIWETAGHSHESQATFASAWDNKKSTEEISVSNAMMTGTDSDAVWPFSIHNLSHLIKF